MGEIVQLKTNGKRQCSAEASSTGKRCSITALPESDLCWRHDPSHDQPPRGLKALKVNGRPKTLGEQLQAAKDRMVGLADVAMQTVEEILQDPLAKSADRLKAAQMVLDRAVAQRIEVEQASGDVRDLDAEIEEALAEVRDDLKTGTDG